MHTVFVEDFMWEHKTCFAGRIQVSVMPINKLDPTRYFLVILACRQLRFGLEKCGSDISHEFYGLEGRVCMHTVSGM